MKTTIKSLVLTFLSTVMLAFLAQASPTEIKGTIVSAPCDKPLDKVAIYLIGSNDTAYSDESGAFVLQLMENEGDSVAFVKEGFSDLHYAVSQVPERPVMKAPGMKQNMFTKALLPIALGIIMLGLGLSLTVEDFRRVVVFPKAVIVGLACQMLILPVACFFIAKGFGLPPALAVGLMLLAASPGGATANLFSHLSKGDVALNITLTAINSILTLFTLPLIVNFSIGYFMECDQGMAMQFKKVIEVFAIVLVPVSIGMFIKSKSPNITKKLEKPVKILSAIFLVLIIVGAVMKEKENIADYFQQVGIAALAFNLVSMGIGYLVPQVLKLGKKQSIAIGMEIGIHNGTLAIYIALQVLGDSQMSIPPAIYSLIMFFTAAAFGYLVNLNRKKEE